MRRWLLPLLAALTMAGCAAEGRLSHPRPPAAVIRDERGAPCVVYAEDIYGRPICRAYAHP